MLFEVLGEDLRKQLSHITKNLRGGRKSTLYIEIYEDNIIFVYRNIEMPISVLNHISEEHKLRAIYTISDYALLHKLIKKFNNCDSYLLDFYPNSIRIQIGSVKFEVSANLQ